MIIVVTNSCISRTFPSMIFQQFKSGELQVLLHSAGNFLSLQGPQGLENARVALFTRSSARLSLDGNLHCIYEIK